MQITIEGASTDQEFGSPQTVVSAVTPVTSPFGDKTVYLAGSTTKSRFYRFTFTSTTNNIDFLGGFDIRGFGFHNY